MTVSTDPRIGSELVGYRIEALLGRGGMSVVYRAEDLALGRKVALKLLAPELAADERFRERFHRESRLAASIDHPHIVPVYEAGEAGGQLYIAMRYVEGSDLKVLLREQGSLEPERVLAIVSQVADALDEAHERGLIHRDIKPSNVLIARQGGKEHCYLGDFGLTKSASDRSGLTHSGQIVGTIDYVAPEVVEGKPVGAPADLYSFGCLLYECLTGQVPYPRDSELSVLWAHVNEPPPKPSEHSSLPRSLDSVIAKALAKDPAQRFGSAGELHAEAAAALAEAKPAPTTSRRRRLLVIAIAAVAIAAVLATVLSLVFTGGENGASGPSTKPTLQITADSIQRIDPATNRHVATIRAGTATPAALAVGGGSVWVANKDRNLIYRIDPRSNAVSSRPGNGEPTGLTFGGGSLWIFNQLHGNLLQLDPSSGRVRPIALPEGSSKGALTADGEQVWLAHATAAGNLILVDERSSRAQTVSARKPSLPESFFSDVALFRGSLWATGIDTEVPGGALVSKIDPRTKRILGDVSLEGTCAGCAGNPGQLAAGEEGVWVAGSNDTLYEIDRSGTRILQKVQAGNGAYTVAVGAGSVWVANFLAGTVTRIDPRGGKVVATIKVGPNPSDLVVGEDGVWVAVHPES